MHCFMIINKLLKCEITILKCTLQICKCKNMKYCYWTKYLLSPIFMLNKGCNEPRLLIWPGFCLIRSSHNNNKNIILHLSILLKKFVLVHLLKFCMGRKSWKHKDSIPQIVNTFNDKVKSGGSNMMGILENLT